IIHADVYDQFVDAFTEGFRGLVIGDPTDEATDVGPLVTEQGRTDLEELVDDAVSKGAKVLIGGSRVERPGWFYEPTILADITDEMEIYSAEAFGPVAALYRVENIDEAIAIANDTTFGLGGNAWTTDEAEQDQFIDRIESGQVFINGMTTSYPELGFGGIKR
ncbi:aldehyde dehydrogenase family protein, partial [Klebsiella quasipneumoniae]|nr:aldehyde dehydrogenase family protein [Klebsiella quasipneumoniae]